MKLFGLHNAICRAPEAEGGAAPAAPTTTFENTQTASTENVLDVLHFDPFKNGDEIPAAKPAGKTDNAPSGEGNEADGNSAKSTPPAQAPETKSAASANTAPNDQVQHWQQLAEHYRQLHEAAQKPAGGQDTGDNTPQLPTYDFQLPDELIGALTGEDPVKFKQGLTGFAKGIALAIHQQMAAHMEATYNPRFEALPGAIHQMLQQQAQHKSVHDDFYGKYPELDQPQLKNFVKQVGEQVAKELGKKAWDTELRDATAKRVKELMGVAASGAKPAAKAPAKMLGSQGSRPAAPANDEARDIVDTLFGNND